MINIENQLINKQTTCDSRSACGGRRHGGASEITEQHIIGFEMLVRDREACRSKNLAPAGTNKCTSFWLFDWINSPTLSIMAVTILAREVGASRTTTNRVSLDDINVRKCGSNLGQSASMVNSASALSTLSLFDAGFDRVWSFRFRFVVDVHDCVGNMAVFCLPAPLFLLWCRRLAVR